MKKIFFAISIIAFSLLTACNRKESKSELPRVAIAGIHIESSTFSPAVTYRDGFKVTTGDSLMMRYPFMDVDSGVVNRAMWLPTLHARAIPGGIVDRETYESFVKEILEKLQASLPLDGLFLDIHGAMSVQDLDDPEGDLITRIREVIGNDVLVSASMDLHGSVSPTLAHLTDLITCYRLAPHEDALISRKRAVTNLLDRIESRKGKPAYKAWIKVPILLPGEKTSTRIEPAKSLYAQIPHLLDTTNVTDAAIWMSYPWADEPRNHAVVMAYGDNKDSVGAVAEKIAKHFWRVRNEFDFVAPTDYLPKCLENAIASKVKPYIISDMGDNPTAGGAGDVTWTITEILKRPEFKSANGKKVIYASIPDKEFVKKAVELGEGNKISGTAGANIDNRYAPPVPISGTIKTIYKGKDNTIVVVEVGSVDIIVTKVRKPYHYEKDFTELGLNPREADILVVKIGYLVPELYDMRGDWIMALTPGGVDQDLMRLPYKRVVHPIFPLDKDMKDPDLSAVFIPLANQPMN